MRRYHKALAVVAVCALALAAGLLRTHLAAPRTLTSQEVLAATRAAVDDAVDAAIERGGLEDAGAFVREAIAVHLRRQGFPVRDVRLRFPNDLNPYAPFAFYANASGVEARFEVEGTRDPLLAIRLGLDVRIRADPHHPYAGHRDPGVLAVCLDRRYYHASPDGPDLFARLENRTGDPYRHGFETLLEGGGRLAVDHTFLDTGSWGLTPAQAARYGR